MTENLFFDKVKVVPGVHAMRYHEVLLCVAVPYSCSVLLDSGGEHVQGVFYVVNGTVIVLSSVDDQGLLTPIDWVLDCHQSAAIGSVFQQ